MVVHAISAASRKPKAVRLPKMWRERWKEVVRRELLTAPFPDAFVRLGTKLSGVFASTGGGGRGQSSLSGGGAAWESLVAWYCNLCLVGTTSVVFKKHSHVPEPIKDALSVSYKGVESNKEADLIAVTFPNPPEVQPEPTMEVIASSMFSECSVSIIQCKTNWNDNSQIPMMWNILYEALKVEGITLGRNGSSWAGCGSSPTPSSRSKQMILTRSSPRASLRGGARI